MRDETTGLSEKEKYLMWLNVINAVREAAKFPLLPNRYDKIINDKREFMS